MPRPANHNSNKRRPQKRGGRRRRSSNLLEGLPADVEDEIQTEAQLYERVSQVQLIIDKLINERRIIIKARQSQDLQRPESRVLAKHPKFQPHREKRGSDGAQ